jgi:hypothetical protein
MEVAMCAAILTEPFMQKLPLFLPVHLVQFAFLFVVHSILQSPHPARVVAHDLFISSLTAEVALEEGQRSPHRPRSRFPRDGRITVGYGHHLPRTPAENDGDGIPTEVMGFRWCRGDFNPLR